MSGTPTIILASLSDEQLKKSIDSLVSHVDEAMKKMVQSTNNAVGEMEAKLKSLGNIKIDTGGSADGGTAKRTKAQNEEAAAVKSTTQAHKEKSLTLDQQASALNTAIQSEKRYTDEVLRQAAAIRATKEWQEKGHVIMGDVNYYDKERANASKREKQQLLSLEEQIVQVQQNEAEAARRAAQETHNQAQAQQRVQQSAAGTAKIIESVHEMQKRSVNFSKGNASISNFAIELESAKRLSEKMKELREQYNSMNFGQRFSKEGQAIAQQIREISRQSQILNSQLNRPTKKEVFGLSEKTIDDIARKMQALTSYRSGLNASTQVREIATVNDEYGRLKKRMDEVLQKNQQMIASNTALGRSWNYMKNRLAFYFTVGASTQFLKNLIEVRSQYEMNERALGILINSAERGTQIFNELSQMALVSPYTLIELSSAAKQLTAYDIAAKDVVNTTRRLADMAAAVGIPIERLTYALGQIKAYGYLNSRDARMFANAGIPLVKQLSDYYTELEGRLVSTADVYDRIKKKSIDYNEVMEVINKMTDQGGKFFDFQAKMADTLKVRLANLTLAWNNMLNDIGKESQGVLNWGIGALRDLFLQWKQLDNLIKNMALAVGVRTLLVAIRAATIGLTSFGRAATWNAILGKKLGGVVVGLAKSFGTLFSSRLTWFALLAMAAVEATQAIFGVNEAQKALNESIRNGAKDNYDNISKFLEQYKEVRESLYTTQKVGIGNIYNPATGKAEATAYTEQRVGQDIDKNEAKKAWEVVREQIELTVTSSDKYIGSLLSISNMSERVRQGFNLLDDIQVVNAALKELDDDTIKVSQDLSAWWNAWQAPDGLVGNLKDYQEILDDIIAKYGTLESFRENTFLGGKGSDDLNDYQTALERFRDDLQETTDSILNFIELKGWSGDEGKINQVFEQITQKLVLDNQLDPQKAFTLQVEVEEARSKAAKQALLQRINDEKAALKIANDESVREALAADIERYNSWNETNGRSKVEWERFTKWLKEQHISETTAMFRNMDAEDIKSLNFQEGKHAEWVNRMVTQYAKEHKMSYDEAFKYLRSWVRSANQWSIFIPLTISTEDKKSVYDQLGEYDKAVDEADAKIERLTKRIGELNAKKQKSKEETQELTDAEQELANAQKAKADAEAKGGHGKKEKKDERNANKAAKQAESELAKALKDELSTIDKVRSIYKDLTKEGMSHADAVERATRGWDETVNAINKVLRKNGLQKLSLSKFAGVENPRELVNMLQSQLNILVGRGVKAGDIKELQEKIQTLSVDAEKYDLTKITKGLNNELGKLKDEYELALELDANPELGDMFADMFGIDTKELPHTFSEAYDRANKIAKEKLNELKVDTKDFDLMSTVIKGDKDNKWLGLETTSQPVQDLIKNQKTWQDMFKKNMVDSQKMLDDYVKKYGDYSDKIAEIESDRLSRIKRLNETYYNEELRKRPEYIAQLNAINQGASREKSNVEFEDFKNSRYYTMMFENLDYISTKTIRDMRDRLRELMDSMKNLTPEQLKQVMSQYEKLEQKLTKRSPFKTLSKDLKEYFKTSKDRKAANEAFRNAQKEYDAQKKNVAALKEKYEQAKANDDTSQSYLTYLQAELITQDGILQKLKEQLDAAQKKADKYNLTAKLARSEMAAVAQMVATNLSSLGELRDQINALFGVDGSKGETLFGFEADAVIDDLTKVGNEVSKIISSAQSGNVVGIASGVVGTVSGIGDAIASIFGDGAARTKRINKEINKSKESVRLLKMAYEDLERAVDKSLGTAETEARRSAIANKEAELAELERQMQLEQSKRSKDRDDDAIKEYQETIHSLRNEIDDLKEDLVNNLWGSDVKSAAESFVDTWVNAWKAGKTTLKDIKDEMNDIMLNIIKKGVSSKIVENFLSPIYKELDSMTKEGSLGGVALTNEELIAIANMSKTAAVDINEALKALYGQLDVLGVVRRNNNLSALQQGLQSMSEDTGSAVESYLNIVSQRIFEQNGYLLQIRDTLLLFDFDTQLATISGILLQLQNSYQTQQAIRQILEGVLVPSGRAFAVELLS